MGWLGKTFNSSIGKKATMAVTGLGLTLFVVVHLAGVGTIFRGRLAFAAHAARLQSLSWLLRPAELLLLLFFLTHLGMGLRLFLENRRARPDRYAVNRSAGGATWGSRAMPYTGLFLLFFLLPHLFSFRLGGQAALGDRLREELARPATAVFYLTALLALGLHLGHGLWSSLQSLGVSHPKYQRGLENGGRTAALLVAAIFGMIPLLALFWPGFLR